MLIEHHFQAYDLIQLFELQVLYACLRLRETGGEMSPLVRRVFDTLSQMYLQRYHVPLPEASSMVMERALGVLTAMSRLRGYNRYIDAMYMWATNPTF